MCVPTIPKLILNAIGWIAIAANPNQACSFRPLRIGASIYRPVIWSVTGQPIYPLAKLPVVTLFGCKAESTMSPVLLQQPLPH